MSIWLTIFVLLYIIIAYFINLMILSEHAKDFSGDLDDVHPTTLKVFWIVLSLLWPVLVAWVLVENLIKWATRGKK